MSHEFIPEIIYFDTQPLHSCHWPHVSSSIQSLVKAIRPHGIKLRIPIAVENELENHFTRDIQEYRSSVENVNKKLTRIGIAAVPLPDGSDLLSKYRALVASAKERLQIESVNLPHRSIGEFFKDAILGAPPFRQTHDRGFKDAVILHSILEDLETSSARVGVLVTANDRDFGSPVRFVKDYKRLVILKDTNTVIQSIEMSSVAAFLNRSALTVADLERSPEFDYVDLPNFISSRGADPGSTASHRNPYEPGEIIDLSCNMGSSGFGPAQIGDQHWACAWYAGAVEYYGDSVAMPAQTGEVTGRFKCEGIIDGYRDNPLVSNDLLFRVSLVGEGGVTLTVEREPDGLMNSRRIEYLFDKLKLTQLSR
jgi:hypothetical protein